MKHLKINGILIPDVFNSYERENWLVALAVQQESPQIAIHSYLSSRPDC